MTFADFLKNDFVLLITERTKAAKINWNCFQTFGSDFKLADGWMMIVYSVT